MTFRLLYHYPEKCRVFRYSGESSLQEYTDALYPLLSIDKVHLFPDHIHHRLRIDSFFHCHPQNTSRTGLLLGTS